VKKVVESVKGKDVMTVSVEYLRSFAKKASPR
jgi:hypothetical protein